MCSWKIALSNYNSVLWQLWNTHLHTVVHLADHIPSASVTDCGWLACLRRTSSTGTQLVFSQKTNNSIQLRSRVNTISHHITQFQDVLRTLLPGTPSFIAAHLMNRSSLCFRDEGLYFAQMKCSCLRKLLLCFSHAWFCSFWHYALSVWMRSAPVVIFCVM